MWTVGYTNSDCIDSEIWSRHIEIDMNMIVNDYLNQLII